ncbi:MAG: hypothetical protein EZS28_010762, partial [Streblomastix strix]
MVGWVGRALGGWVGIPNLKPNSITFEDILLWRRYSFQISKDFRVHLIHNTQTGLLAAKVMQNSLFDEKEWEAAGRLQQGDPIPFIVQFKAAKQFDEMVVILIEFANLRTLDHIIKKNYTLKPGTLRAIA